MYNLDPCWLWCSNVHSDCCVRVIYVKSYVSELVGGGKSGFERICEQVSPFLPLNIYIYFLSLLLSLLLLLSFFLLLLPFTIVYEGRAWCSASCFPLLWTNFLLCSSFWAKNVLLVTFKASSTSLISYVTFCSKFHLKSCHLWCLFLLSTHRKLILL